MLMSAAQKEVLGDLTLIEYVKQLNDRISLLESYPYSGWCEYQDTQYTSESPFTVSADTDTVIPNNALTIRQDQKPKDIETFYNPDNGIVSGRYGDGMIAHVDFKFKAANTTNAYFDVWIDLGGSVQDRDWETIPLSGL